MAVVETKEKIHYVSFVEMMTRNDLVGNSNSFGFLEKKIKIANKDIMSTIVNNECETRRRKRVVMYAE